MIDGYTYRLSQTLARRQISTWELAQIHHVAFEHQAFPRGINSTQELAQILNIMQENRFEPYVREWEGLSDHDIQTLVDALVDYVLMCKRYFPTTPIKLPLSTMMASYSIYKKLAGYHPDFKSLLEIGPGSGNTMFFLRNHQALQDYSAVEACEAYYLLQSMVGTQTFGLAFEERAFPQDQHGAQHTFTVCHELERPRYVTCEAKRRAFHYPWWRLGEVADKGKHFDLVTSNANLTEFSERALRDYLHLIKRVLKDQGALIAQCFGGPVARNTATLIEFMKREGFGALCISSETMLMDVKVAGRHRSKYTCLRNGIFVQGGHPLFQEAFDNMHFKHPVIADHHPPVISAFFDPDTPRRAPSADEMERHVRQSLKRFATP